MMATLQDEILQGLDLARLVGRRLHKNRMIGSDELDSIESIADKLGRKVRHAVIIEPQTKPERHEAEQFDLPLPTDDN